MASTDARAFPTKNTAYRVTFPIYDADGDLVTGAAGLDSEISKDGGTFADCTNEATEIATSSGIYYLDLTNTEMNADTVAIIVKTSTSGAKTTVLVMYPVTLTTVQLGVNTVNVAGTAQTARDLGASVLLSVGTGTGQVNLSSGKVPATIAAGDIANAAITAAAVATDAIDNDAIAADVSAVIADAVWNALTASYGSASTYGALIESGNVGGGAVVAASVTGAVGSVTGAVGSVTGSVASVTGAVGSVTGAVGSVTGAVGSVTGNVGGNVTGSVGSVASGGIAAASFAAGAINAAAIATGAIDADALAADAVDEILDEVVEGALTMRQILRLALATLAGKSSGGGTATIIFRDNADSKARITATVDANGNRTAMTVDGT
jgi:hypothetical protein